MPTDKINPLLNSLATLCWLSANNATTQQLQEKFPDKDQQLQLLTLARRHRVTPLLIKIKNRLDANLFSADFLLALKQQQQQLTEKNLRYCAAWLQIQDAFTASKIPCIAFKGPSLALLHYQDPGQRQFADLDMRIALQHYHTAKQCLETLGYRAAHRFTAKQWQHHTKHCKDVAFYHPQKKILLELHLRFNHLPHHFTSIYQHIESYSQNFLFHQRSITTLDDETLACYLAIHGSYHGFSCLQWLIDFHRQIQRCDFARLQKLCRQFHCQKQMALAFAMGQQVLSIEPPAGPWQSVDITHLTQLCLRQYQQAARQHLYQHKLQEDWISFCLAPNYKERWRIIRRYFTTSYNDWKLLSLPDRYFFLYYGLRPFLWLKRFWQQHESK